MSDWITTYGGIHFFPLKPEADKIKITDVAHALSLICRRNGHVKSFFSVGQHCIHCALEAEARGYGAKTALACLLHDASEAYMSDVPRPFKQYLSGYISHEKDLLNIVYTKYLGSTLTEEEEKRIKEIDDDMLYYDLKILLGEISREEPPEMKTAFSYEVLPFETVEKRYLELYERYLGFLREAEEWEIKRPLHQEEAQWSER